MIRSTIDFSEAYWKHYLLLENEFERTLLYVTFDEENFKTYSEMYLKLILEIGSEIDIALKELCKLLNPSFNGKNMKKYKECIKENSSEFILQEISVINRDMKFNVWEKWQENENEEDYYKKNDSISPDWWKVYNKIKHERTGYWEIDNDKNNNCKEYYKFANLKNTIYAMAALYQILMHIQYKIAEREGSKEFFPYPFSRLFKLSDGPWEKIKYKHNRLCDVYGNVLYMQIPML